MILSIPFRNLYRHKWSSLVLTLVFALSTLVLFWVFGFSNTFESFAFNVYRDIFGDVYVQTPFTDRAKYAEILKPFKLKDATDVRVVLAMVDTPKHSHMIAVFEMEPKWLPHLSKYLRPVIGRLPERPDEVLLPNLQYKGLIQPGEYVYLTTQTPSKVINTMKYKVVGLAWAWNLFITPEGMNQLLGDTQSVDSVLVRLNPGNVTPPLKLVNEHSDKIVKAFKAAGLEITETLTVYGNMKKVQVMLQVFTGIKVIIVAVLFPLVGAVLGSLVWMYAFRRRKEIWTYISLGMRDRTALLLMGAEYLILALFGICLGLIGGYFSSSVFDARNVWLVFGYMFQCPLIATITPYNILFTFAFILVTVGIWVRWPLMKIIKEKPFTY